jgi:hypothetical protein
MSFSGPFRTPFVWHPDPDAVRRMVTAGAGLIKRVEDAQVKGKKVIERIK